MLRGRLQMPRRTYRLVFIISQFQKDQLSIWTLRSLQDLSASIVFRALGGDSAPTGGKLGSCSAACLPLAPQQRPPHETEGGGLELGGGCWHFWHRSWQGTDGNYWSMERLHSRRYTEATHAPQPQIALKKIPNIVTHTIVTIVLFIFAASIRPW